MKKKKREENERKFSDWENLESGGRIYWFEITQKFYQEIFNEKGKLVEIHEKYPVDKGHKKIK